MHGRSDSWVSCICPHKDLLSPEQTRESHRVIKKDEEQSSGRVGEETSSAAVIRNLSNAGLFYLVNRRDEVERLSVPK